MELGVGEEVVVDGLLAIADVDRKAMGRLWSSLFGGSVVVAEALIELGLLDNSDAFMLAMPLLNGGSFGAEAGAGEGDTFGADCDLLRDSFELEEDPLRLSALLVDKWPGVWLSR